MSEVELRQKLLNGKYQIVAVDKLTVHPRNPRRGNVKRLRGLIRANGFHGVLLVQKSTGYIVAGNHRFLAAREEGFSKLPVIWLDVDDEEALRILVADNRGSDDATNDNSLLAEILMEFSNYDGFGYSEDEVAAIVNKAQAPTEFPDATVTTMNTTHECPKCGFKWS